MRTTLQIQRSVIFAFFIRELKTRFGSYRLGYLWALLEPLGHILMFVAIFGALGRRTMPGIEYPLFIITGMFPFFFFRYVWTRSADAVKSNRALLAYRYVQPLDNIWARALLELLIFFVGFVVYLIGFASFGMDVFPHRPLEVFCAYALLFIFAIGVGIVSGVVCALSPEIKKCIPFINRPLYLISGVFIPLSVVPEKYRGFLLWNPILHALELARENYFASFEHGGASWSFLGMGAMVSLFVGLALYRVTRFKLLES